MLPKPGPEPYTLPVTLRVTRRKILANLVIYLLVIALPLYYLATTNILDNPKTWILCFLLIAGLGLSCLYTVSHKIRLAEDSISYRQWFFKKEMDYTRITAVRFYSQNAGEGGSVPMLELCGDSGNKITISLGLFDSPKNRLIIYDVLKKKAILAGINKSMEEFYTDMDTIPRIKNLLPQSYTLPLTLRMHQNTSLIWFFIFPLLIAVLLILALVSEPMITIPGWMVFLGGLAGFSFVYLLYVLPAVRLTEGRISYREQFSWKEMDYSRITTVRYYYQDLSSTPDSGQMLEVSGDSGNTITICIGMFDNPGNIWIIYDVLKMKAPQAGLRNSPDEFFTHPGAPAGS